MQNLRSLSLCNGLIYFSVLLLYACLIGHSTLCVSLRIHEHRRTEESNQSHKSVRFVSSSPLLQPPFARADVISVVVSMLTGMFLPSQFLIAPLLQGCEQEILREAARCLLHYARNGPAPPSGDVSSLAEGAHGPGVVVVSDRLHHHAGDVHYC